MYMLQTTALSLQGLTAGRRLLLRLHQPPLSVRQPPLALLLQGGQPLHIFMLQMRRLLRRFLLRSAAGHHSLQEELTEVERQPVVGAARMHFNNPHLRVDVVVLPQRQRWQQESMLPPVERRRFMLVRHLELQPKGRKPECQRPPPGQHCGKLHLERCVRTMSGTVLQQGNASQLLQRAWHIAPLHNLEEQRLAHLHAPLDL